MQFVPYLLSCLFISLGLKSVDSRVFNDRSFPVDSNGQRITFDTVKAMSRKYNFGMSTQEIQAAVTPNGTDTYATVHWMRIFFHKYGDHQPNADGIIDVGFVEISHIWEEYKLDMAEYYKGHKIVSYSSFCNLWSTVFPNVKTSAYKHCSTKCQTCTSLSMGRRKYRDE